MNDRYITQSASGEETHIGNHDGAIPMYAVGKASYDLGKSIVLDFSATFYVMAGAEDTWNALEQMTFYPSVAYTLPDDWGVLRGGVRFKVADGVLDKFSIPIIWEYNIKSK